MPRTTAPSSPPARLYGTHRLRRVYYSAFSPIPDAARALPLAALPTVREHRLRRPTG